MKAKAFIITGPAGAGKSTISKILAEQIENCVNIEADDVKHMIMCGYVYDDVQNRPRFTQWSLLGSIMGLMAQEFIKQGYSVILNGYINEPAWDAVQKKVNIDKKILLMPNFYDVVQRDVGRDKRHTLGKSVIYRHYEYFSTCGYYNDYKKINTTTITIGQTAGIILEYLNQ